MNVWLKYALAGLAGAAVGFAYWNFIGCQSGTCPITSSPVNSSLYGAVMGLLLVPRGTRPSRDSESK